jgi:hypothetical protein
MNSADGLNGWNPAGKNVLRQNELPDGSCSKEVKVTSKNPKKPSMGILTDYHPFFILQGDRWVRGPAKQIFGRFTMCLEEYSYILNPLRKKIISIFFLQNKKDLVFPNREI